MDTLAIIRIIASTGIITNLRDALELADAIAAESGAPATPNFSTHEGRVALARTIPAVMDALADGKKITAIKALREFSQSYPGGPCSIGLKEAKDAVDAIVPPGQSFSY